VTATGGTLIAHGVTTVHSTRVIGTYLDNGLYAQVVKNTAKVFRDEVKATPVVERLGTVQHVTERPSFGIAVASNEAQRIELPEKESLALETLFESENESTGPSAPSSGVGSVEVLKPTSIIGRRKNAGATTDFRARLKSRYQNFRREQESQEQQQEQQQQAPQGVVGRGTVTPFGRTSRRITSGHRTERQRSFDDDVEEEDEQEIQAEGRGLKFGSSSFSSGRRNRYRNRNSPSSRVRQQEAKEEEVPADLEVGESSLHEETVANSRNRVSSSNTRSRAGANRIRNRLNTRRKTEVTSRNNNNSGSSSNSSFKPKRPTSSSNFRAQSQSRSPPKAQTNDDMTPKPKFSFKKFDRGQRPDYRLSLLQKILKKGKPTTNTLSLEEQEKAKEDKRQLEDDEQLSTNEELVEYEVEEDEDILQVTVDKK
jgi:hypothetical protein